ncbi:alkylation response protein AidB-like acyl-CoA dehydrogenase [Crossiella equi]|uniref:Alkylation response protein AidB-like acyl-CoA dehydrogenase n=1 Tax=Crossiella equi TaxID=130796 RepID=A0ABS5ANC5_9PSEU|nr:acyl-CoA dehydrogenase family protein [Crossiella equi]MBP2478078.1 alkylation response protein AidB-like acyl-CoA dehydrogenase [Crossiella equi]
MPVQATSTHTTSTHATSTQAEATPSVATPPGAAHETDSTWRHLADTGLLTLATPERLGGAGLGVLEIAVLLTELGRSANATPALVYRTLSHLALGVLPLARLGTVEQQDRWLKSTPDSEQLTAALFQPRSHPSTRLYRNRLIGTKTLVPQADSARLLLVTADLDDGGEGVLLVDPASPGLEVVPSHTSSGVAECTVRFDGAEHLGLLGEDRTGQAAAELRRCAVAGVCALGDGLLAGALELTVAHAGSRHQFGKPLAAFQAVAMQLADVRIASRTLGLITRSACWRLGEGLPAQEELGHAAFWLGEHLPAALATCHHLHGGLGLDITYPLHRYSALGRDLVRLLGAVHAH